MTDEFAEWAVLALSALAHDSRLQVHRLLVQAGEGGLSAGAIAEQLNIPASSLSFHLAHMQAAEMVMRTARWPIVDLLGQFRVHGCTDGVPTGELLQRHFDPGVAEQRPARETTPESTAGGQRSIMSTKENAS